MQGGNYYNDSLPYQWMVFRRMEPTSSQYHVLSRSSFSDPRSFDDLIFSGDASPVHPSFYYICRDIDIVAEEYSQIAPRMGHTIKRGIHESTEHSNLEYVRQRLCFLIFEHFAQMVSRRIVVQHASSLQDWPSHKKVLRLEADVMASWYDWFVADGLHRNNEDIGFCCEVSRHYIELQNYSFDNDNEDEE